MCRAVDLLPKVSSKWLSSNQISSSSPPLLTIFKKIGWYRLGSSNKWEEGSSFFLLSRYKEISLLLTNTRNSIFYWCLPLLLINVSLIFKQRLLKTFSLTVIINNFQWQKHGRFNKNTESASARWSAFKASHWVGYYSHNLIIVFTTRFLFSFFFKTHNKNNAFTIFN